MRSPFCLLSYPRPVRIFLHLQHNVHLMDGVMFMHSARLQLLQKTLPSLGPLRRINSEFCFKANEAFFQSNIRCSKATEPLGCLGDLGYVAWGGERRGYRGQRRPSRMAKPRRNSHVLSPPCPPPPSLPPPVQMVQHPLDPVGYELVPPCPCSWLRAERERRRCPLRVFGRAALRVWVLRHFLLFLPHARDAIGGTCVQGGRRSRSMDRRMDRYMERS